MSEEKKEDPHAPKVNDVGGIKIVLTQKEQLSFDKYCLTLDHDATYNDYLRWKNSYRITHHIYK